MTKNFSSYSQYYDLLYQDKNYQEEAEYISRHIKQVLPSADLLLELGSGTGNHAYFLCPMGYTITGIERSVEMVKHAKAKHIAGFTTLVNDITNFELDTRFDAVIALFHSICYLLTNAQLLACFAKVSEHLKPGGIFAFDIWYGPAVLNKLPHTRIKRMQNEHVEIIRIAETDMHFNKNIAEVNYEMIIKDKTNSTYSIVKEKHPMRYFTIPEIEMLADLSGFTVIVEEEFLNAKQPGINSWNIFMLLKKVANA